MNAVTGLTRSSRGLFCRRGRFDVAVIGRIRFMGRIVENDPWHRVGGTSISELSTKNSGSWLPASSPPLWMLMVWSITTE